MIQSEIGNSYSLEERRRLRDLVEISWLRYKKDKSLKEILSLHQEYKNIDKIRRMLEAAKAAGIVDPKPHFHPPRLIQLENELRKRYEHLREAIIVPASSNYDLQRHVIIQAAADYLDAQIKGKSNLKVAFTGGNMSFELVRALPEKTRDIDLYPLALFPRGPVIEHIDPFVVLTDLWSKSGRLPGKIHFVTITPYKPNASLHDIRERCNQDRKQKHVRDMIEAIKNVDIAITSVGTVKRLPEHNSAIPLALVEAMRVKDQARIKSKIVGDVAYCHINEQGNTPPELDFFLNIGTETIGCMAQHPRKKVIVFGGGVGRQDTLRAALRGILCNVVVTDEGTAEHLLKN